MSLSCLQSLNLFDSSISVSIRWTNNDSVCLNDLKGLKQLEEVGLTLGVFNRRHHARRRDRRLFLLPSRATPRFTEPSRRRRLRPPPPPRFAVPPRSLSSTTFTPFLIASSTISDPYSPSSPPPPISVATNFQSSTQPLPHAILVPPSPCTDPPPFSLCRTACPIADSLPTIATSPPFRIQIPDFPSFPYTDFPSAPSSCHHPSSPIPSSLSNRASSTLTSSPNLDGSHHAEHCASTPPASPPVHSSRRPSPSPLLLGWSAFPLPTFPRPLLPSPLTNLPPPFPPSRFPRASRPIARSDATALSEITPPR